MKIKENNFKNNIFLKNKKSSITATLLVVLLLTSCGVTPYAPLTSTENYTLSDYQNEIMKNYLSNSLKSQSTEELLLAQEYSIKREKIVIEESLEQKNINAVYLKLITAELNSRGVLLNTKEKIKEKTLEELKAEFKQAIKEENYLLAKELDEKIEIEKEKKKKYISDLKLQKEKALSEENYLLAKELHKKIENEENEEK